MKAFGDPRKRKLSYVFGGDQGEVLLIVRCSPQDLRRRFQTYFGD